MFVKQCHGIFELLNRIGLKVHHQQDKLRPSYQIQKLRFHIVSIKGRGIHQLDLNVIHRHHPGSRFPGSVRKTGHFRGLYHVLMGSISPLQGIGPEELKIEPLLERLRRSRPAR